MVVTYHHRGSRLNTCRQRRSSLGCMVHCYVPYLQIRPLCTLRDGRHRYTQGPHAFVDLDGTIHHCVFDTIAWDICTNRLTVILSEPELQSDKGRASHQRQAPTSAATLRHRVLSARPSTRSGSSSGHGTYVIWVLISSSIRSKSRYIPQWRRKVGN